MGGEVRGRDMKKGMVGDGSGLDEAFDLYKRM
jgi:hypothetical protein